MLKVIQEALTFDDVLLVPNSSNVLPSETSLKTSLTSKIQLNMPLVSAAMDTVTESELAISIAQEGGIGIIHKNLSPQDQANEVLKVKKYESGVITNPVVTSPDCSIKEVIELTSKHKISGVPVVEGKNLVGIVTSRDLRFVKKVNPKVSTIMTPKERLVTVQEGASREKVKKLFHEYRIEKILVINSKFQLKGMITVKDLQKSKDFPNACKDGLERLRVGAAIGVGKDMQDRLKKLTDAETDVIVVDTAHGHSKMVIDAIKSIRKQYPKLQLIAGNIATKEAAKALVKAGVDAIKVGIGPGSICTTRIVAGVGVPQITAISEAASAVRGTTVKVIADGGIRFSGDISKALAAGADSVMLGSLFAGTTEAPGEIELYQGRTYKNYRGMGSIGAMKSGSSERYFQGNETTSDKFVPEGIEGRVPYKGGLANILHQLLGGIRSSMGYLGCSNIKELHTKAKFVKITNAGMKESHVHDVMITKEAPNYQIDK
ncbi:MAG: IMP dehydrogenase [Pseudomonadota bacterium]|mgnify:FL=1|jgi:IMP dehydrogenase|nr:IMP dehydrogenase [Pseudomonadota bacterium]|tara:strand:+ start:1095 stop:2561 length:1467 start_codon:yes stop_codon:yes gene_type:complete